MADLKYAPAEAGVAVRKALDDLQESIERAHDDIRSMEQRSRMLVEYLRFCECPRCGAELTGNAGDARQHCEAAALIGREDVPCAFCDTEEQRTAFLDALDRTE